jgi:hypothetical protein
MDLSRELRELYTKGQGRRELFDALSGYTNRVAETPIDRAMSATGMSYDAVIALFKELEALGIGKFKLGRKGAKTRLVWNYAPRTVGSVAKGASDRLEAYFEDGGAAPISETMINQEPPQVYDSHYLIAEAKRELAAKLRISPEQITISVNLVG